ncbi:hypothetical protein ASPWEDRAFT_406172 [Aspergillus wentii DTO 134E9]|uniref:Uncharacterized protein n=1 Tax=Aspergillus wentii DTO 134E9 TaxID=1073089 RepID=A0A1L9RNC9_ASPWE|nr:uncharacterized protein ASPWEDRAFT_406172 [Aspergillus wentii DTO 134E9]OJJ36426.1 hypothetical protein ASPWEDRAFT_406172 [Aspergillus wentii DTO 134E9]
MSASKMRRRYKQCEIYLLDPGSLNVTSIMRPFGEFPVCGAEENPKKWKRILTRGSGHGLTTDPWLAMLLPQLTRLERLEVSFDADSTFTLLLLPKVIAMRNEIDTPLSGGILNSLKDFRGVCVENEWEPSTGKREVTPINDCFLHLPSLRSFHAVHDILPRSELAKKPVLDFTELDIHVIRSGEDMPRLLSMCKTLERFSYVQRHGKLSTETCYLIIRIVCEN